MSEITPGISLHLWIDSGADMNCDPCGLFVVKVEFPDGRIVDGNYVGFSTIKRPILDQLSSRLGGWVIALQLLAVSLFVRLWLYPTKTKLR